MFYSAKGGRWHRATAKPRRGDTEGKTHTHLPYTIYKPIGKTPDVGWAGTDKGKDKR